MTTPEVIFRRKGTRVIYPYTETNAKNKNLISMTVEEAQAEGLLSPKKENVSAETERSNALAEENASLRDKIKALEAASQPKKVTKKTVAKKVEAVTTAVEQDIPIPGEAVPSSLAELGL